LVTRSGPTSKSFSQISPRPSRGTEGTPIAIARNEAKSTLKKKKGQSRADESIAVPEVRTSHI